VLIFYVDNHYLQCISTVSQQLQRAQCQQRQDRLDNGENDFYEGVRNGVVKNLS